MQAAKKVLEVKAEVPEPRLQKSQDQAVSEKVIAPEVQKNAPQPPVKQEALPSQAAEKQSQHPHSSAQQINDKLTTRGTVDSSGLHQQGFKPQPQPQIAEEALTDQAKHSKGAALIEKPSKPAAASQAGGIVSLVISAPQVFLLALSSGPT